MSFRRVLLLASLAAVTYLVSAGCGSMPRIPDIEEVRDVPRSDQLVDIPVEQIAPKFGPVGTIITVSGKGVLFPSGIVTVLFTGGGQSIFELDEPTQKLHIRVPFGAKSGPFGFSIAGRTRFITNPLPTTDLMDAYRVPFPGFAVTPDPDFPAGLIEQPGGYSPSGPGDRTHEFEDGEYTFR